MNSLLYYYNNVQKMAAFRQAKRMQRGVKLGYNQSPTADSATKFTGGAVPIGVGDFSVEYFGNSYGSGAYPFLCSVSGTFSCRSAAVGQNGVSSIIVGDSDDPIQVGWAAQSSEDRFYLAVTRSGVTVKVYINGELKATKEQSAVKDLGDLQLAIANSSDVGFVRVWNYAFSADEIATLDNNGDPMGYVVPKAKRDGLLAEYLPQNLMYGRDDKTIATSWLDSAKQLPLSDEYMEPLFQSIGGYDMAANGAPEILYNE